MTPEEIDAMCMEAVRDADRDGVPHIRYHFAARVAAAEREACAKVCELLVKEFKETGGRPYDWKSQGAEDCVYEIRARGQ